MHRTIYLWKGRGVPQLDGEVGVATGGDEVARDVGEAAPELAHVPLGRGLDLGEEPLHGDHVPPEIEEPVVLAGVVLVEGLLLLLPLVFLDGHFLPQHVPLVAQLLEVVGQGLVRLVRGFQLVLQGRVQLDELVASADREGCTFL